MIRGVSVLEAKWKGLVETRPAWSFADLLLRTYSQIVFSNNPLTGLLLLIGFTINPAAGILSILSSASAIATAELTHTDRALVRSGLFGCNGALVGLALSAFLPLNLPVTLLSVSGSVLSALLTKFLISTLSFKYNLPVLSIPFLIVTWGALLITRTSPDIFAAPGILASVSAGGRVEQLLHSLLPVPVASIFRSLSAVFFQNSVYFGVLCILGIVTYSRISTLFGLAAGTAGIALYYVFAPSGNYYGALTVGFNCALISIALGGIFVRLTWQSTLCTALAVLAGVPISLGLLDLMGNRGISPLAGPFNLITIGVLLALRTAPALSQRLQLQPLPLALVSRPENNVRWRIRTPRFAQQTTLSLPFYGVWYISAGNDGQATHSGKSVYAWDFIVLDKKKRPYRNIGADNEDYYSFSLPVLAPAAGRVVKVTDSVRDNRPLGPNWELSWGNCVIIDHGNNEFSEISHLRQHSIVVQEGDQVIAGQLLGYCGNSGLSTAPHIHYQLQNAGSLGSETLPAKFHCFTVHSGKKRTAVKAMAPQEAQFVANRPSEES